MKYIKTKDGIFELMFPNEEYKISFDNKTIEPAYFTIERDWVAKKDVIKQADTVEELCDEFVCIKYGPYGKLHPWVLSDFETLKRENNYPTAQIYGAIWVLDNNGAPTLKPVAKMNDKGELELL